MNITSHRESASWLLLIFSLPSKRTSERVGIWRKLQKYGTLALRNSGYVLPNTPANQERFEWLATAIRGFKGEASVLQVLAIDDLPSDVLKEKFREERKPDYTALIREVQQLKPSTQGFSIQLARLKRRFEEIVEVDFFECQLKAKAEEALYKAEHPVTAQERVRIDGQVQWVAGTRMQVMTGGGSVAVDLRQADQAAHRGLRPGERVIVDGFVAEDRRSIVAREIWRIGYDQSAGQAP